MQSTLWSMVFFCGEGDLVANLIECAALVPLGYWQSPPRCMIFVVLYVVGILPASKTRVDVDVLNVVSFFLEECEYFCATRINSPLITTGFCFCVFLAVKEEAINI